MVVHTVIPALEAKAGRSSKFKVSLVYTTNEFWDSQGYTYRPNLKKTINQSILPNIF